MLITDAKAFVANSRELGCDTCESKRRGSKPAVQAIVPIESIYPVGFAVLRNIRVDLSGDRPPQFRIQSSDLLRYAEAALQLFFEKLDLRRRQ